MKRLLTVLLITLLARPLIGEITPQTVFDEIKNVPGYGGVGFLKMAYEGHRSKYGSNWEKEPFSVIMMTGSGSIDDYRYYQKTPFIKEMVTLLWGYDKKHYLYTWTLELERNGTMPAGKLVLNLKYRYQSRFSDDPKPGLLGQEALAETSFQWLEKALGVSADESVSTIVVSNSSAAPVWVFVNKVSLGQVNSRATSQAFREGFQTSGGQVGGWGDAEKGFKAMIIQNAGKETVPTDHVFYSYFGEPLQPETRMVGIHFGSTTDIDEVAVERAGQIDWQKPLPKEFWFLGDWTSNVVKEQYSVLTEYDKDRQVLKRWGLRLVDAVKLKAVEAQPAK